MLLIQTAFDQEFAAVMAAGASQADQVNGLIRIGDHDCRVLMTGIGPKAAKEQLTSLLARIERPQLVLSIGLAGGLMPELKLGQTFLIDKVWAANQPAQGTDRALPANLELLASNLRERMSVSSLVTLSRPALTSEAKADLAHQHAAALCDMETVAVAEVCREHGVPWLARGWSVTKRARICRPGS